MASMAHKHASHSVFVSSGFGTDSRIGSNTSALPEFPVSKKPILPQTTPHIIMGLNNPSYSNNVQRSISYTREDPNALVSLTKSDSAEINSTNSTLSSIPNGTHIHYPPKTEIAKPPTLHTASRHLKERNLMDSIVSSITKLQEVVNNELSDIDALEQINNEAEDTLRELFNSQQEANHHLKACAQQLEAINEKHRIFTADHIAESPNSSLEEVLEKLTIGLQTATIALYHSPKEKAKTTLKKSAARKSSVMVLKPLDFFKDLIPLGVSSVTGDSSELCSQIIERLQTLRALQIENVEKMKIQHMNAKEAQRLTGIRKNDYKETMEKIKIFEKQLIDKRNLVEHLSGEGDYDNLSSQYLVELCRIINKASRKIVTELALRDIRVANAQSNITVGAIDKENCLVCFERKWNTTLSPCGHLLCNECSERLNFCPQCRAKIESRQKCFQP